MDVCFAFVTGGVVTSLKPRINSRLLEGCCRPQFRTVTTNRH